MWNKKVVLSSSSSMMYSVDKWMFAMTAAHYYVQHAWTHNACRIPATPDPVLTLLYSIDISSSELSYQLSIRLVLIYMHVRMRNQMWRGKGEMVTSWISRSLRWYSNYIEINYTSLLPGYDVTCNEGCNWSQWNVWTSVVLKPWPFYSGIPNDVLFETSTQPHSGP